MKKLTTTWSLWIGYIVGSISMWLLHVMVDAGWIRESLVEFFVRFLVVIGILPILWLGCIFGMYLVRLVLQDLKKSNN